MRGQRASIEQIMGLWGSGVIGRIEARNWLANEYPGFKHGRRKDVDEYLEQLGNRVLEEGGEVNMDEGSDE